VVLAVDADDAIFDRGLGVLHLPLVGHGERGKSAGLGLNEADLDLPAGLSPSADRSRRRGNGRRSGGRSARAAAGGRGGAGGRGRASSTSRYQTAKPAAYADRGPRDAGYLEKVAPTDRFALQGCLFSCLS
jgi:hypothetical protein